MNPSPIRVALLAALLLGACSKGGPIGPPVSPGVIEGIVTDASGAPVANAEVLAANAWINRGGGCLMKRPEIFRARTDAEGRFKMKRLFPGNYRVRVGEDGGGFESAVVDLRASGGRVTLRPLAGTSSLRVTVTGADKGRGVMLVPGTLPEEQANLGPEVSIKGVEVGGAILFEHLRAGEFTLLVKDRGSCGASFWSKPVTLGAPEQTVNFDVSGSPTDSYVIHGGENCPP